MFKIGKSGKIIAVILLVIVGLVVFQEFGKPKVDRNSYVTLVQGTALLNNNPLNIKEKEVLKANDIIKTGSSGSLVIIEWGEGSITRLGENTSIRIDKSEVSEDLTKIEILFKMLGDSGKTWSNVVSYIGDESYFKQEFADTEAAVRGTIFEVNLDKDYLFVKKHEVHLKNLKTNENYDVVENKAFDIKSFSFIALQKFILNFQDKTWESINKSLDSEFYKSLKNSINKSLGQINNIAKFEDLNLDELSSFDKEKLYSELLTSYQNIKPSSISPKDSELYKTKLEYQNVLAKLAPEDEKKNILRTSVYDLKEAIDLKNMDDFKSIITLLGENKDVVDFDSLNNFLDSTGLSDSFNKSLNSVLGNFDTEKLNEFMDGGLDGINNATQKTINDLEGKFDMIKNIGNDISDKILKD